MSSPGERNRNPFESPENKDGPPLYNSTDNFLPLGFSTPQHRNQNAQMYSRNYYSAQPKHMLPRQRGFQNRNRGQQQQHGGGSPSSPGGDDGGSGVPERRNWNQNRNWKGGFRHNNQQQQNQHQHGQFQRRNRFGMGHQQNKGSGGYNINDYFHPSMLEDPWMQLVQSSEQAKGDSSDNGEGPAGGGGGSSGLDED
ncbi:uncharacterized protein LOC120431263 isoform X1 [Culex pipiens pallens]|uniref:uncharacterized protein LOC120431263 isoform X1 n=1 Tax=Culex pipiens pallens TaxID=42434 RepID=UPI0019530843|nr:uncharacterized protein LOC120431263 isoform X1 [Culex pipiens pallens]